MTDGIGGGIADAAAAAMGGGINMLDGGGIIAIGIDG